MQSSHLPVDLSQLPYASQEPEYWPIVRWIIAAWAMALVCRHSTYWAMMITQVMPSNRTSPLMRYYYFQMAGALMEVVVALPLAIVAAFGNSRKAVAIMGGAMIGAFILSFALNQINQVQAASRTRTVEILTYAVWQLFSLIYTLAMPILIIVLSSAKRR